MQKIKNNMRLAKYFSITALLLGLGFFISREQPQYLIFDGNIFGTTYHIKIRSTCQDTGLHDKIKAELAKVNAAMSMFEEDSEVSRINQAPAGKELVLSKDMSFLLQRAATVFRQSGGAFDPTIAPLVNLWGFGPDGAGKMPIREEINRALHHVGFDKLRFDKEFKTLHKTDDNLALDLSALAKGYGVDKVASLLAGEGYGDYIVEIGGEVRAAGSRDARGTPWTLGLNAPEKGSRNILALDISGMAAATSGDYRNYRVDKNGKHYAHIISPQTGLPVRSSLASVTVFAKLCVDADAYATALMAMGNKKALDFADRHNIAAIFLTYDATGGFARSYSAAIQKILKE